MYILVESDCSYKNSLVFALAIADFSIVDIVTHTHTHTHSFIKKNTQKKKKKKKKTAKNYVCQIFLDRYKALLTTRPSLYISGISPGRKHQC